MKDYAALIEFAKERITSQRQECLSNPITLTSKEEPLLKTKQYSQNLVGELIFGLKDDAIKTLKKDLKSCSKKEDISETFGRCLYKVFGSLAPVYAKRHNFSIKGCKNSYVTAPLEKLTGYSLVHTIF